MGTKGTKHRVSLTLAQLNLYRATAKTETRYALQGIVVRKTFAAATNGRVLAIIQHKEPTPEGFTGTLLHREEAKTAVALMPRGRKYTPPPAVLDVEGGTHTLHVSRKTSGSVALESKAVEGSVPNVLAVIPKGVPLARVVLNTEYLQALTSILAATDAEFPHMTLEFHPGRSPVVVRGTGGEEARRFLGVVMPVDVSLGGPLNPTLGEMCHRLATALAKEECTASGGEACACFPCGARRILKVAEKAESEWWRPSEED
uniref:Uncharacterized protein n=1 Tax=viral metagenome TaxID=1070528 RepID=A0A6H1ZEL0_9ZZZZ